MRQFLFVIGAAPLLAGIFAFSPADEKKNDWRADTQLRAMADELARSKTLSLGSLEKPYFIQYSSEDSDALIVSGSLGGLIEDSRFRIRRPIVTVRVGDYAFDNSNSVYSQPPRFGVFPLDDDYGSMRSSLWRTTDALYKTAASQITAKRNALREMADPEKIPDLSQAQAVQVLEQLGHLEIDVPAWERAIRDTSAVFGTHPEILGSSVRLQSMYVGFRMANSEGTVVRIPEILNSVEVRATARSADGRPVWNHAFSTSASIAHSPSPHDLQAAAESVASETEAMAHAPLAEDYNGPVLFEGEAAAAMMAQALADAVVLKRKPVAPPNAPTDGSDGLDSVWAARAKSKVAPPWLSIYDDPLATTSGGSSLAGHYTIDDEGVGAQRVDIVRDGVLNGFLMSRLPVRTFNQSNGHGRLPGRFGAAQPAIGNLFVKTSQPVEEAKLKAMLLARAQAAGLHYALIIRRIDFPSTASFGEMQSLARQAQKSGYARTLNQPLLVYRVSLDGREELVRGLRFLEFSAKDLRDVEAMSDRPYVFNYLNNGSSLNMTDLTTSVVTSSVVCPSVLFSSLELARADNDAGAVPIVPPPPLTPGS